MYRFSSTGRVVMLATVLALALALPGHGAGAQSVPPEKPSFGASDRGEEFVPGQILVKPSEKAPPGRLGEINRSTGAEVEDRIPSVGVGVIDLPRDLPVEQAVRRYENAAGIEYAEPDFKIYPEDVTPNDPRFDELYGLENTGQTGGTPNADIAATDAWEQTTGSEETVIAVIDTGVQRGHPDLRGNMWINEDEKYKNGSDDDGNGYEEDRYGWDFYNDDKTVYDSDDGDKHGTHVAGTIGAEADNDKGVTGVNWDVSIMPLKFIGPEYGSVSGAVEALDYAVDNGATISNNSWGFREYDSKTFKDALDRAEEEGHLFVAAAGNADNDNDENPRYPNSYDNENIISVAATDDEDRLASFSNYGEESVDLGAPGVSILSTLPGGGYGKYSGTSMATPHVAGVAALLKSADPDAGASDIKQSIMDSASSTSSLSGKTVSGGRLNAAEALGSARQNDVPEITLRVSNGVIKYGGSTGLVGRLTSSSGDPVSGEEVKLIERPYGQKGFSKIPGGEVTTNSNGVYRLKGLKPEEHTRYRARFAGSEAKSLDPAVSGTPGVKVRVRVHLRMSGKDLKLGDKRGLRGLVIPDHASEVRLTIKRNGVVVNRKMVNLNGDSEYRSVVKPGRTGRYAVSALFYRDEDHWGNRSPEKSFKVVR